MAARVSVDRLVAALEKAGFRKLSDTEKLEFLAELPLMVHDDAVVARLVSVFGESGYAYGYTVHTYGPCIGCFDVYVVIIHRGYDTVNNADYVFVDVDVYHKCFGECNEG